MIKLMGESKVDKGDTLVAVNTTVEGHIRCSGDIYVNGSVIGDIVAMQGCQSTLVVSEEGSVKGEIRIPSVSIYGVVEGNIHADIQVQLGKKARVTGDLHYQLVEMESGAVVDGRMVPREEAVAKVHALPVGGREEQESS